MFDLDGTLIETAPEIGEALNDALRHFDLRQVAPERVSLWIGHGTHELLVQALAFVRETTPQAIRACAALPAMAAEFDRCYQRRCGTRSHLYPRVREVLHALREQGVRLAVITNKEGRHVRTVLDAHGLSPLFDRVISGDTFPTRKPDPAGIRSCLDEFRIAPEHALFVGDSSIDVATARNAGVAVWALPHGYNMGQPIALSQPDRVIADFSALTHGAC